MNIHNIYLLLQMNGPITVGSQESISSAVRFLTTLSQIYKGFSESIISCQYFRAMGNAMGISVLNFYSSACLRNVLTSLHVGCAPVINILALQLLYLGCLNNIFLLLLSGWLIHTLLWIVAAEKNRQRLSNSEDKAFGMFIWGWLALTY